MKINVATRVSSVSITYYHTTAVAVIYILLALFGGGWLGLINHDFIEVYGLSTARAKL